MSIELPPLPYALNALEPYISKETLEYHHGKHHKTYVDNLNKLIQNTEFANQNLEYIIKHSSGRKPRQPADGWTVRPAGRRPGSSESGVGPLPPVSTPHTPTV